MSDVLSYMMNVNSLPSSVPRLYSLITDFHLTLPSMTNPRFSMLTSQIIFGRLGGLVTGISSVAVRE